jgi:predicted O-methyltransferase YrrM
LKLEVIIDDQMAESVKSVLRKIEKLSVSAPLPIIGPQKGQLLIDVIDTYKPKQVLEVGTLVGYSALLIANSLPEDGKVTCMEINEEVARAAEENITIAGLDKKIEIIIGDAKRTITKLTGKYQMLFVDAAKEEYLDYLKAAEPKLSPGAVIVADNVKIFKDTLADYLKYVRNDKKYKSQIYDFGYDAMEVSQLKN